MEPGFALCPANFLIALYNTVRPAYSNILVCVCCKGCDTVLHHNNKDYESQ